MILIFRWFTVFSLLLACHVSAERKEPVLGAGIIERLVAPESRLEALREVIIAKQSDDPTLNWSELPLAAFEAYHKDTRVTVCPQLNGAEPLYLVTFRPDYEAYSMRYSPYRSLRTLDGAFEEVPSKYKPAEILAEQGSSSVWPVDAESHLSLPPPSTLEDCVFVFLTHEGQVIWPFNGDNVGDGDVLKDINGDGQYERVFTSNFGVYDSRKGDPDIWVETLRVETVSADSQRLLHVVLNWHGRKSESVTRWGWEVRDLDGLGLDEIIIGPIIEEGGIPEAEVVYRWDAKTKQFLGADGSLEDRYITLDPKTELWEELRRVRDAGGMQYDAGALSNAAAEAEAELDAVPYDWREREPYVHRSLAGYSDEDLVEFMCGWKLGEASEDDSNVAAESRQQFEFKQEWFALSPKEAAFEYASANQSEAHLEKFTLYYPTNLSEAALADWIALSAIPHSRVNVLKSSGERAGRLVSVHSIRSLPNTYPNGRFRWQWSKRDLDPFRVRWFNETLWWLAQLRSEAKQPGLRSRQGAVMDSNCYPAQTETMRPGVRLLGEAGQAASLDIVGERMSMNVASWRDRYAPDIYLGLASILFEKVRKEYRVGRAHNLSTTEFLEQSTSFAADVQAGRIPPELARATICAAGDDAVVSWLPILREIAETVPSPSEDDVELQRLQEALAALPNDGDIETYKAKVELEAQIVEVQRRLRDNVWSWLRVPLHFAIRQLEAVENPALLEAWAAQPGELGANWAYQRIFEADPEHAFSVLEDVFARLPEWRTKVIRYLAYNQQAERARACIERLPRAEQLLLMPSLVGPTKPAQMSDVLVADLLETIQSDTVPLGVRQSAVQHLTPRDQATALPNPEIDHVYQAVMAREIQGRLDPWPAQALAYELGMILLLRDQLDPSAKLYLQIADEEQGPHSYNSFLPFAVHLAVAKHASESRHWLIEWVDRCIEANGGYWNRLAEVIYAADLKECEGFLSRLATLDASMPEGDSGGGVRQIPGLEQGSRYHLPRQILAAWGEEDTLTRAKCIFLLGMNLSRQSMPEGIFRPVDRIKKSLADTLALLTPEERQAFTEFVTWCSESIGRPYLNYQIRKYFEEMTLRYSEQ